LNSINFFFKFDRYKNLTVEKNSTSTTLLQTMTYEKLRIDYLENGVTHVVLSGNKMNTMNGTFFEEIGRAFDALGVCARTRCIVLLSDKRCFSSGLDLVEASQGFLSGGGDGGDDARNQSVYELVLRWQRCFDALQRCSKPVIAAIHGACIGGGIDLVSAADIRVCSRDAVFSVAETRVGIVADVGSLQRLTGIVGKGAARELAFTADKIDAKRAFELRLVSDVYADRDTLLSQANAMAARIAAHSPRAVQGTKAVLNYADEHTTADSLNHVALWNAAFLNVSDMSEAFSAFIDRRTPTYPDGRVLARL
jgi:Delta3,5-Delta2,4-dienoyl-CoA isomerase